MKINIVQWKENLYWYGTSLKSNRAKETIQRKKKSVLHRNPTRVISKYSQNSVNMKKYPIKIKTVQAIAIPLVISIMHGNELANLIEKTDIVNNFFAVQCTISQSNIVLASFKTIFQLVRFYRTLVSRRALL